MDAAGKSRKSEKTVYGLVYYYIAHYLSLIFVHQLQTTS